MSTVDLPGPVTEVEKSGSQWMVSFLNVPWSSVFGDQDLSDGDQEEAFRKLWWQQHSGLSKPSALMDSVLKKLEPYRNYTASEILASIMAQGFKDEALATEQVVERLQLMPRWNGWNSQRNPGFYWAFGKHFCQEREPKDHVRALTGTPGD